MNRLRIWLIHQFGGMTWNDFPLDVRLEMLELFMKRTQDSHLYKSMTGEVRAREKILSAAFGAAAKRQEERYREALRTMDERFGKDV